jgi:hypothetical protein
VDFGLGENNDQRATHALVFMVVALNGSFKIPIAHFFTTGINAKGRQVISEGQGHGILYFRFFNE